MKYYKENEEQKKRDKYLRWNQKRIEHSEEALTKSTHQILCQRMPNCKNKGTKKCFSCTRNKTRSAMVKAEDYYLPKIAGLKYF